MGYSDSIYYTINFIIILGVGLFNEIKAPYEGYEMKALIIIGLALFFNLYDSICFK